jgi:hypothetical protein
VVDTILEAGNLLQLEVDGKQVVLEMRKKTIATIKARLVSAHIPFWTAPRFTWYRQPGLNSLSTATVTVIQ